MGGNFPNGGDSVIVVAAHNLTYDVEAPAFDAVTVDGTLTCTGWHNPFSAATITVNGTITHPINDATNGLMGVYESWSPNNRVWLKCANPTTITYLRETADVAAQALASMTVPTWGAPYPARLRMRQIDQGSSSSIGIHKRKLSVIPNDDLSPTDDALITLESVGASCPFGARRYFWNGKCLNEFTSILTANENTNYTCHSYHVTLAYGLRRHRHARHLRDCRPRWARVEQTGHPQRAHR